MQENTGGVFNLKEYRGCSIRPASYKTIDNEWVPEACFSVQTNCGLRRLWIASFVHCFASPDLTFSKKIDADAWALRLARELIDRTLPQFVDPSTKNEPPKQNCVAKVLSIVRRPFSAIHAGKDFKNRN